MRADAHARWLFEQEPPTDHRAPCQCLYCPGEARIVPDDCFNGNAFHEQVVELGKATYFHRHPAPDDAAYTVLGAVQLRACAAGHFTGLWILEDNADASDFDF